MRSQRSGDAHAPGGSTRSRCAARKRAVDAVGGDHEVLDQLLRAVLLVGLQVGDVVAVEDRRAPRSSRGERAELVPLPAQPLRRVVLQPQVLGEAGRPPPRAAGAGALPSSQAPTRVVGELRLVAHQRAVARRRRPPRRRRPRSVDTTTASRSSSALSDVRSVESRSGSIGKISRGGVDGGGVVRARAGRSRESRAARARRRRRRRRGRCTVAVARRHHRELVEVARVVVVDRAPRQVREVAAPRRPLAPSAAASPHRGDLGRRRRREVGQQSALDHGASSDALQSRPVAVDGTSVHEPSYLAASRPAGASTRPARDRP